MEKYMDSLRQSYEKRQQQSSGTQLAVYDTLKEAIISREIGQTISENMVARAFGVSRTPVREAIKRLSNDGYIEVSQGKTAQVIFTSEQDLRDISPILRSLYTVATEYCIKRASDDEINQLDEIVELIRFYVQRNNLEQTYVQTNAFHLKVCELSRNAWLLRMTKDLMDHISAQAMYVLTMPGRMEELHGDHKLLLEVIRERKLEQVPQAIYAHVRADRLVMTPAASACGEAGCSSDQG